MALVRVLKVFISSPMDVPAERKRAIGCLEELNAEPAIAARFRLVPIAFETGAPAAMGEEPQSLVDCYAGKSADADIVVCIFGRRMGTKTRDGKVSYRSGTYYEFVSAANARRRRRPRWPQILLYRIRRPAPAGETRTQRIQAAAVARFFKGFWQEQATYRGLPKELAESDDFGGTLKADLRLILETDFQPPATSGERLKNWLEQRLITWMHPSERVRRNREDMLANVSEAWIENALEDFTVGFRAPIRLKVRYGGETAVRDPAPGGGLEEISESGEILPTTSDLVVARFLQLDSSMVLLGEAGAGKTFQLLELTRRLIKYAQSAETEPIPILLNLSTWPQQEELEEWLLRELVTFYHVPRAIALGWINNRHLLLCLDGLDEITVAAVNENDPGQEQEAPDELEARVQQRALRVRRLRELNDYRPRKSGKVKIILCCRTSEYEALGMPLALSKGVDPRVFVETLSEEELTAHLLNEDELSNLRAVIKASTVWGEMARNLFLLNAMTSAYNNLEGINVAAMLNAGITAPALRESLFNRYIARRVTQACPFVHLHHPGEKLRPRDIFVGLAAGAIDRFKPKPYQCTVRDVDEFLPELARQMEKFGAIFLVERMQMKWLPANEWWKFRVMSALGMFIFICLTVVIPVGLAIGAEWGLTTRDVGQGVAHGLQSGGWAALTGGGLVAVGYALCKDWKFGIVLGFAFAICRGIAVGAGATFEYGWGEGWYAGGITACLSVPLLWILYWVRTRQGKEDAPSVWKHPWAWLHYWWSAKGGGGDARDAIRPLESKNWDLSWTLCGALSGVLVGMILWRVSGPARGLGFGLGLPPLLAFAFGQRGTRVSLKTQPNQGIRQSAINAFRYWIGLLLFGPLAFGLGYGYERGLVSGVVNGLLGLGLSVGVLTLGIVPVIKHFGLRILLAWSGRIPFHYVRFLQATVKLHLLRRVGGGYMFEHPDLYTYFREHALDQQALPDPQVDGPGVPPDAAATP